ncbi:hypothetical protein L596_024883 [Steinernema carpocapsae]|uniref:Uncharacterized protein n=1 Tax=Steinernema carpocapsae TaxID=34508 RepID=A0A4U5M653_STECR|nr:hypothetical protein L596_024883 [Steinernema carpocapsae]
MCNPDSIGPFQSICELGLTSSQPSFKALLDEVVEPQNFSLTNRPGVRNITQARLRLILARLFSSALIWLFSTPTKRSVEDVKQQQEKTRRNAPKLRQEASGLRYQNEDILKTRQSFLRNTIDEEEIGGLGKNLEFILWPKYRIA